MVTHGYFCLQPSVLQFWIRSHGYFFFGVLGATGTSILGFGLQFSLFSLGFVAMGISLCVGQWVLVFWEWSYGSLLLFWVGDGVELGVLPLLVRECVFFLTEPSWSPSQGAIFWLARLSTIVNARASRRESGMDPFYKYWVLVKVLDLAFRGVLHLLPNYTGFLFRN